MLKVLTDARFYGLAVSFATAWRTRTLRHDVTASRGDAIELRSAIDDILLGAVAETALNSCFFAEDRREDPHVFAAALCSFQVLYMLV